MTYKEVYQYYQNEFKLLLKKHFSALMDFPEISNFKNYK